MPRYSIVVTCKEDTPKHFEITRGGFHPSREPVELHTTDPTKLKYVLLTHIGNFEREYGCPDAGGHILTKEDLPNLKIRKGTIMVECQHGVVEYMPSSRVCSNCGWRCWGGTGFGDGQFFCWHNGCQKKWSEKAKAHKRAAIEKHSSEGLCIFDQAWIGLCSNEALTGHSVCSDHLGIQCRCGAQATRECSNAGSLVCGRPLCDEHKCLQHS